MVPKASKLNPSPNCQHIRSTTVEVEQFKWQRNMTVDLNSAPFKLLSVARKNCGRRHGLSGKPCTREGKREGEVRPLPR